MNNILSKPIILIIFFFTFLLGNEVAVVTKNNGIKNHHIFELDFRAIIKLITAMADK